MSNGYECSDSVYTCSSSAEMVTNLYNERFSNDMTIIYRKICTIHYTRLFAFKLLWHDSHIIIGIYLLFFIQNFIHKRVNGIGQQAQPILALSLQQGQGYTYYISIILKLYKFHRKNKEKQETRTEKLQLGTGVEFIFYMELLINRAVNHTH